MQNDIKYETILSAPAALREWLDPNRGNHENWQQASAVLRDIEASAQASNLPEMAELAGLLFSLLEIAELQTPTDLIPSPEIQEILAFVDAGLQVLVDAVERDEINSAALKTITGQAQGRWGECLQLVTSTESNKSHVEFSELTTTEICSNGDIPHAVAMNPQEAAAQISMLLAAIGATVEDSPEFEPTLESTGQHAQFPLEFTLDDESPSEFFTDVDLRDAFMHDATRCLSTIEQTVLATESSSRQGESHRLICRELHTLKGASASVGFRKMANYLHGIEESIERQANAGRNLESDKLLNAVDALRAQISKFDPPAPRAATIELMPSRPAHTNFGNHNSSSIVAENLDDDGQTSIRVRSSTLDRLMDLLAELVVLRNRRGTQISELDVYTQELTHCAARLKRFADQLCDYSKSFPRNESNTSSKGMLEAHSEFGHIHLGLEMASSRATSEVANDLSEISRAIKSVSRPIAEENEALTHFIRQFRQEMMQLRRLPVSGLFQRLQRAARDAARAETKQVQVDCIDEQTAIDQSLQEKLYEPLLHLVRNAVSHGIEDDATRKECGKSPLGRVTLRISSSSNLLVINISDDGRGLDYDALRRRGYERGLLSPDRSPTEQELAKLIFHPGFSTRENATEISGRGVGMDVVATVMDRLHGRIEVDSVRNQGTTIRLSIPLRSGIEHAMVFRSGGQLFAIPMQSVSEIQNSVQERDPRASTASSSARNPIVSFSRVVSLTNFEAQPHCRQLILDIASGSRGERCRFNLVVDEIVGGEEVVVRALPRSLKQHPLANGITLSGGGEIVLMIDPVRLWEMCQPHLADEQAAEPCRRVVDSAHSQTKKVLVVDDSLSARTSLVKRLRRHGLETVEACDGMKALDYLRSDSFQLVITDLDMPRLGGLELLNEIRQRRLSDTPVVVVSSRSEDIIRNRANRYGARAFLSKPVTDETLADLLHQFHLIAPLNL